MSKWISVDNEYPAKEGKYLVCLAVGSMQVKDMIDVRLIRDRDIERKNTNMGDWIRLTHWMPLPTPPNNKA